jgi:hypothetical protein
MKYKNIREEELKNKVGAHWFEKFDTTEIIGNIDFTVFPKQVNLFGRAPLLWAEAKTGNFDVVTMFVQLILTIGKARTFDKTIPPAFLGAFDFKKIAFVPYINIEDIFYLNDFNWNVTPSNHETKEFLLIKERIEKTLIQHSYIFDYEKDEKYLREFIKNNVAKATSSNKIKIDKNNFIPIYLRWLEFVKPIIDVNWDDLKKAKIYDSSFYLADLFVEDNNTQTIDDDITIRDSLFVVYQNQGYKIAKENIKQMFDATITIKNKEIYQQFWKLYKRPPIKEFQQYIIERKDLLVPQDIREITGAFFTPRIWVELSQKYLTDYLGENWQDDYYVWDCAAGTGNLLAGLENKYNIYASTLDQADINVMHERIDNGANLLKSHVFQFDFLNDDFTKLPQSLKDIINDPEKRKKLVMYINPPYAEHLNIKNTNSKENNLNKAGLKFTKIDNKYSPKYGSKASRELFVQFFIRINEEIPNATIASFSKLKYLNSSNFIQFRKVFKAKYQKGFICPSITFDNVKGNFPIGFLIWNTEEKDEINSNILDIFDSKGSFSGTKLIYLPKGIKGRLSMNDWIKLFEFQNCKYLIGKINCSSQDFLHQNYTGITIIKQNSAYKQLSINELNLIIIGIYFSVTFCIEATWINDRDQYLFPVDGWQTDLEFQNDCLVFTLFHGQNRITSKEGTNHWIPFTEQEVNAHEKFESHVMSDFIKGKIKVENSAQLALYNSINTLVNNEPRVFSPEAQGVFDAGRELWKYYHSQNDVDINVNASFYDIRAYFQGTNAQGRMNARSEDARYTKLIGELRNNLSVLADKIKPKVYEYGFLKE